MYSAQAIPKQDIYALGHRTNVQLKCCGDPASCWGAWLVLSAKSSDITGTNIMKFIPVTCNIVYIMQSCNNWLSNCGGSGLCCTNN